MQWFGSLLGVLFVDMILDQMVFATCKAQWIQDGRSYDPYYNPYQNGSPDPPPPFVTGNKRNDEEIVALKVVACDTSFATYFGYAKFCPKSRCRTVVSGCF